MWKTLERLKEKITGKPAKPAAPAEPRVEAAETAASEARQPSANDEPPQVPGLKELEKKGVLGQFFRHWKNPAFLRQAQALAARMKAAGVDLKDAKAVQAWIEAHKKDLDGDATGEAPQRPQTFVRSEPVVGRNDPCPCASGKKYKKCCGAGK